MPEQNDISLNKFISETGFCSRREADKLIETGRVTVNGKLPKLGNRVNHDDVVKIDGQTLKLSGRGEPGHNGGSAGDLLLKIHVLSDPMFERKGDDLYAEIRVSLFIAVLGGKASLRTFKGTIKVNIPKESQNGKVLRLQELGMPKHGKANQFGDLYAKLSIEIPANLNEKEIKLFKELEEKRKLARPANWYSKRIFC